MKLWILLLGIFTACRTTSSLPEKATIPVEYIQMSGPGKNLHLHKYETGQIARQFRGKGEFDQLMRALALERWDTVIAEAKKHLKKYPGNEDALLLLAMANLAKGQPDLAAFFANLVLKGDPKNSNALNLLGVVHRHRALMMEDYREATSYFNLAHLAAPQSIAPLLNLGLIYLEIGNFEAAYNHFSTAKDICQSCPKAVLGLASAAQALGQYKEAEAGFLAVLKSSPRDPIASYLLAVQKFYVEGDASTSRKIIDDILAQGQFDTETKRYATDLLARIETRQRSLKTKENGILAH